MTITFAGVWWTLFTWHKNIRLLSQCKEYKFRHGWTDREPTNKPLYLKILKSNTQIPVGKQIRTHRLCIKSCLNSLLRFQQDGNLWRVYRRRIKARKIPNRGDLHSKRFSIIFDTNPYTSGYHSTTEKTLVFPCL